MKKNHHLIIASIVMFAFQSCAGISILQTIEKELPNAPACTNPTYVSTMAKKSGKKLIDKDGKPYGAKGIGAYDLLQTARAKYGDTVTIQNIRWDVKGTHRKAAIFDVIICK
jgi:hypothetical protein